MNFPSVTSETFALNIPGLDRNAAQVDPAGQVYPSADPQENPQSGTAAGEPAATSSPGQEASQENGSTESQTSETAPDGTPLTEQELRLVEELKTVDDEVRRHEMAHVAAGGSLVTSGAQFSYATGPDGQQYAVAGEVGIDTSPVPGDPQATIDKMERVKQAALAPASPSSQDLKVASQAKAVILEAAGELTLLTAKQQAAAGNSQTPGASSGQAADTYAKVSALPENDTYTFQLAV